MIRTDPARMPVAERLAEIGSLLAAGIQRCIAAECKPGRGSENSQDPLDDVPVVEAPCRSSTEVPS